MRSTPASPMSTLSLSDWGSNGDLSPELFLLRDDELSPRSLPLRQTTAMVRTQLLVASSGDDEHDPYLGVGGGGDPFNLTAWDNASDWGNGTGGIDDDGDGGYNYWALLLIVFSIFAVFGNMLVILAVKRERSLWNVTNYFIVSLAVADLLVAGVVMPFGVYVLVSLEILVSICWHSAISSFSFSSLYAETTYIKSVHASFFFRINTFFFSLHLIFCDGNVIQFMLNKHVCNGRGVRAIYRNMTNVVMKDGMITYLRGPTFVLCLLSPLLPRASLIAHTLLKIPPSHQQQTYYEPGGVGGGG